MDSNRAKSRPHYLIADQLELSGPRLTSNPATGSSDGSLFRESVLFIEIMAGSLQRFSRRQAPGVEAGTGAGLTAGLEVPLPSGKAVAATLPIETPFDFTTTRDKITVFAKTWGKYWWSTIVVCGCSRL